MTSRVAGSDTVEFTICFGGKIFDVYVDPNANYKTETIASLAHYATATSPPNASSDAKRNILSFTPHAPESEIRANNPRILSLSGAGRIWDFKSATVAVNLSQESGLLDIRVHIRKKVGLIPALRYVTSRELGSAQDMVIQVIHELVLIPALLILEDRCVLHGSAVAFGSQGVMISGTGGVGKSSMLLEFAKDNEFAFLSDDMAVVAGNGTIYPNMAPPKIYGYNWDRMPPQAKQLIGRSRINRAHFSVGRRIKPDYFRRKISPSDLFSNRPVGEPVMLNHAIILLRSDTESVVIDSISPQQFAEATVAVIIHEYMVIFNMLWLESFNRQLLDVPGSPLHPSRLEEKLRQVTLEGIRNANLYTVQVPLNATPSQFCPLVFDFVKQLLNNDPSSAV